MLSPIFVSFELPLPQPILFLPFWSPYYPHKLVSNTPLADTFGRFGPITVINRCSANGLSRNEWRWFSLWDNLSVGSHRTGVLLVEWVFSFYIAVRQSYFCKYSEDQFMMRVAIANFTNRTCEKVVGIIQFHDEKVQLYELQSNQRKSKCANK